MARLPKNRQITTPVPVSGSGGAASVTAKDVSEDVSGTVDELVFQDGSLSITDSTATVTSLPTSGANYNSAFGSGNLALAVTMNQVAAPVFDRIRGRELYLQDGGPLYEQTGHFATGTAIRLGREYGLVTTLSDPALANVSTTVCRQTVTFWGKPYATGYGYFWSFNISSSVRFYLFNDATSIRAVDINSSTVSANVTYTDLAARTTPIDIFDGAFHMFTATREYDSQLGNRIIRFYIDGQLVAENNGASATGAHGLNSSRFTIGGDSLDASAAAICDYDELLIAPEVWSGGVIDANYFGGTGTSFANVSNQYWGYSGDALSGFNAFIAHIWRFSESAGINIADTRSFANLTLSQTGSETLGQTGRWASTTAIEFDGTTDNVRAIRNENFDGPNSITSWAVSMDILIDGRGTTGAFNNYVFEIGDGANTSNPYANFGIRGNSDYMFCSLGSSGAAYYYFDAADVIDSAWHTVTFGVRVITGRREVFICFDDHLHYTEVTSFPDLSASTIDVTIGDTQKFSGFAHRTIVGKIQNVVMWKGVDFDNDTILALNGAQLTQITE